MSGPKMTAVTTGTFTLEKSKLMMFAPGTVTIPILCGIFQHPKHGVILWDTGCWEDVAEPDGPNHYWGEGIKTAFGAENFTQESSIKKQIDKLGIQPQDVKYVIYSHLHLDHAGGMSYFPNAIHVMQRDELRYALCPNAWIRPVYVRNDFRDLHKLKVLEVDGDTDFFGDGTFMLLKAPGHAPGMQCLMVTLPNQGRFILGGDVAHLREQFETMVPMPWDYSCNLMSKSRPRIKQLERSGIPVYLTHEMTDFEKLPKNGEWWD